MVPFDTCPTMYSVPSGPTSSVPQIGWCGIEVGDWKLAPSSIEREKMFPGVGLLELLQDS